MIYRPLQCRRSHETCVCGLAYPAHGVLDCVQEDHGCCMGAGNEKAQQHAKDWCCDSSPLVAFGARWWLLHGEMNLGC